MDPSHSHPDDAEEEMEMDFGSGNSDQEIDEDDSPRVDFPNTTVQEIKLDDDTNGGCNFLGLTYEKCKKEPLLVDTNEVLREKLNGILAQFQEIQHSVQGGRKKKRNKQFKKNVYDQKIAELESCVTSCGLSDEELELLWKIISKHDVNLNCTQRRKLVFTLLPKRKVGDRLIKSIIYWLKDAVSKGFRPTELVAVYQLLIMYSENRLVEDNGIINETVITRILTPATENYVIPWKMKLFRSIVAPDMLSPIHIDALKKLLKIKDAKKTHIDDIQAALGLCKHMRPDLFDDNESFSWKTRNLNFPQDACRQFHNTKRRIQVETDRELHPLADRIFPEFLPDTYRSGRFVRATPLEEMLKNLESEVKTVAMAFQPSLLQVFQDWLGPMLYFRFNASSGVNTDEDYHRYCFIFERCTLISKTRQEGLPILNEWLVKSIDCLDFWKFRVLVMELLTFIPPNYILSHGKKLRNVLFSRFQYSPDLRCSIWDLLECLFDKWLQELKVLSDYEPNQEMPPTYSKLDVEEFLKWIKNLMDQCVDAAVLFTSNSDEKTSFLVNRMCLFYLKVRLQFEKGLNLTADVLENLGNLPKSLLSVAVLSECSDAIRIFSHIVKDRLPELSALQMRERILGLHSVLSGAWVPHMALQPVNELSVRDLDQNLRVQLSGLRNDLYGNYYEIMYHSSSGDDQID